MFTNVPRAGVPRGISESHQPSITCPKTNAATSQCKAMATRVYLFKDESRPMYASKKRETSVDHFSPGRYTHIKFCFQHQMIHGAQYRPDNCLRLVSGCCWFTNAAPTRQT